MLVDKINSDIKTYGLDLYVLLRYGRLVFFAFGGTVEQYNSLVAEYNACFA